jgi:hypothetical protein
MTGSGAEAVGVRALDAPATRRWMRHRVIGAIAGVLLGGGLVAGGLLVRATTGDPVQVGPTSREAMATITALRHLSNGLLGATSHIIVTYRAEDGRDHTAEIDVGVPKPQYAAGVTVPVVYQKADFDAAQLEGVPTNPPVPWVVPFGLGVVGLVLGPLLFGRVWMIGRTLRENPWVMVRSTLVEATANPTGARRPVAVFLELDGAPDAEPVLAGPLPPRLVPELVPDAWVAGSGRRFVVAATGGAPLGRTQRARLRPRATSERRWARRQPSA